jgi:hypothetical protein
MVTSERHIHMNYVDLAKTVTYQKHKDNLFLLDQGNLNIVVFQNEHKFGNFIGVETLTKAMAPMFPKETGFHPTLIQNFSLPRKAAFMNLSTTFSEFIAEQQQQQPMADLSIFLLTLHRQTKLGEPPLQRTFLTEFLFQLLEYTKRLELCTVVLMRNVLPVIDMHVEY